MVSTFQTLGYGCQGVLWLFEGNRNESPGKVIAEMLKRSVPLDHCLQVWFSATCSVSEGSFLRGEDMRTGLHSRQAFQSLWVFPKMVIPFGEFLHCIVLVDIRETPFL